MISPFFRRTLSLAVAFAFGGSIALATNGYFRHGIGVKQAAMAGAGTALSLSPLSSATNPASLSFLAPQYEINIGLFMPDRD